MALPDRIDGLINYAAAHRETWAANLGLLQLSQLEIDQLASLVDDLVAKRAASIHATEASRSATIDQNLALTRVRKLMGGLMTKIKATAKLSDDPDEIYAAADLPVPKTPTDLKAPPPPTAVKGQINSDGEVELSWKNPSKDAFKGSTYFLIDRAMRLGSTMQPFHRIAAPADRKFTDTTVPPGYDGATYRVFATRNNKTSPSDSVNVSFGVGLGQPSTATHAVNSTQDQPVTRAA